MIFLELVAHLLSPFEYNGMFFFTLWHYFVSIILSLSEAVMDHRKPVNVLGVTLGDRGKVDANNGDYSPTISPLF